MPLEPEKRASSSGPSEDGSRGGRQVNQDSVPDALLSGIHPINRLWLNELAASGYPLNYRAAIDDMGASSSQLEFETPEFYSTLQERIYGEQLRGLVAAREQAGADKKIVLFHAGLGYVGVEAERILRETNNAIMDSAAHPDAWSIKYYGIDIDSETAEYMGVHLAEEFDGKTCCRLHVRTSHANINDFEMLTGALLSMGAPGLRADYIFQRRTSYANSKVTCCDSMTQPLEPARLVGKDIAGAALDCIFAKLRAYLPYRNLFALVGRDAVEAGDQATRMILEVSEHFTKLSSNCQHSTKLPKGLMQCIPPGTRLCGPPGMGFLELENLSTVLATSMEAFFEAIRRTAIDYSGSQKNNVGNFRGI